MSFIGDIFGGGDDAAKASMRGAEITAAGQREGLEYLKEREELPRQFSEAALKGLGGLYGLPGGTGSQQDLIDKAISSPLYQSLMGGKEAGEEAILRSASATGGLRSGDVPSNLYKYDTQLQNQALLQSYNQQLQGLSGLAGLPSYAPQIAQGYAGVGQTLGQGQVAAGQAKETGKQQGFNNLLGLGALGVSMFSDRRLKRNIVKIDEVGGHNWYMWEWNAVANKMGLNGESEGVLADEIVMTDPDCIGFKDGFMIVNYTKLGIFKEAGNA